MKTKTGCMLLVSLMLTASETTLAADNLHFYGNLLSKSLWGGDQFWTESEQPGRSCKP